MILSYAVIAALLLGSLCFCIYFAWRGIVHGMRRQKIVVRGITYHGKMARRLGIVSIAYSILCLLSALFSAWKLIYDLP